MSEILDLTGRVALVTGGGQGVGREIALRLAAHNAKGVIVNDYFEERARSVAEEIQAAGVQALGLQADVTNGDSVNEMFAQAADQFGAVDILVNNAGNAGPDGGAAEARPFWETGPSDWEPWLGVNLYGVLNVTRAAVSGMVERNYGKIVTVISDAGRVGEPHLVVYSGAKAGAAGFMRSLARAVGRFGITANCVALAAIRTPTTEPMLEDEDAVKAMLRSYVIRRIGEPADAANMVLFLSSDASSWITGQTYPVNGGFSLNL